MLIATHSAPVADGRSAEGPDNLHRGSAALDFWIWLDPRRLLIRRQVERHGRLSSLSIANQADPATPPATGADAPVWLTYGALQPAETEQLLEAVRCNGFAHHPSRLTAMQLFRSEAGAAAFRAHRPLQLRGHCLRRVRADGPYAFSVHDLRWLMTLRSGPHPMSAAVECARRYWLGVGGNALLPGVVAARAGPVVEEVLFSGTVSLYDTWLPHP